MELALALGEPSVTRMLETMTDRDLDGWAAYAKKHGLPQKRQELYLAQVAQGNRGGPISDYLLRPPGERPEERSATIHEIAKVGGGNVIYIAKG